MPASECQCSDVWGVALRWVSLGNWGSTALPGVSAEVGLLVFPSDKFTSPGLIETPQVGYLAVFVKSLSRVQLFVTTWTAAPQASLSSTIS